MSEKEFVELVYQYGIFGPQALKGVDPDLAESAIYAWDGEFDENDSERETYRKFAAYYWL